MTGILKNETLFRESLLRPLIKSPLHGGCFRFALSITLASCHAITLLRSKDELVNMLKSAKHQYFLYPFGLQHFGKQKFFKIVMLKLVVRK